MSTQSMNLNNHRMTLMKKRSVKKVIFMAPALLSTDPPSPTLKLPTACEWFGKELMAGGELHRERREESSYGS